MMNNPWGKISKPASDVYVRRIDHTHSLDLFWGKDLHGKYLFIYEYSRPEDTGQRKFPDLTGINIFTTISKFPKEKNRLILQLKDTGDWEIFYILCNDVVEATRKSIAGNSLDIILRRVLRWHELLKKDLKHFLSEEKIKGLIGELIFLKKYLIPVFGAEQAVNFWKGPAGSPQDFNVNETAIEVKSQSGISPPRVKISSINQLSPQLPEMYLYVVTLGKAQSDRDDVITLPGLIEDIVSQAGYMEKFIDLLHMNDYVKSDYYSEFSYILTKEVMFRVEMGFPRLTPDALHRGITKVIYDISLADCEPFKGMPNWIGDQSDIN
ncbi:PD-(D/E)XK motif protein [Candidatus Omnitrophota bacterium]